MKKILIIEDERVLAEIYKEKLSGAGFEVSLALDAEGGFKAAKKEKPDLILLDVLLPGENGISFLSRLKKDPEISSIPVIVFSNYDDPKTKRKAFTLGAKSYLIKTNYTPSQLVDIIKKELG